MVVTSRRVGVGLAQITSTVGAPEDNRARCTVAVREAAAGGAGIIVLPELVVPGYTADAEVLAAAAEPVDGPTVAGWRALAEETGALVVGGFCERGTDLPYNSVVAVDARGVVLHYRKLHLFGAEKSCFAPGDLGLPVVDTPVGRLGVCVCYDLRFVEVLRVLALRGAEVVCVPTAWVAGFDTVADQRTHGCAQSDGAQLQANLNQVFVACASQSGPGDACTFLGSSLLAGPTGAALSGPRSRTEQWVGTCVIDLDEVARAQDRGGGITPRADRRTDVYGLSYLGQDLETASTGEQQGAQP